MRLLSVAPYLKLRVVRIKFILNASLLNTFFRLFNSHRKVEHLQGCDLSALLPPSPGWIKVEHQKIFAKGYPGDLG